MRWERAVSGAASTTVASAEGRLDEQLSLRQPRQLRCRGRRKPRRMAVGRPETTSRLALSNATIPSTVERLHDVRYALPALACERDVGDVLIRPSVFSNLMRGLLVGM